MNTFTTPINVPNVSRAKASSVLINQDTSTAFVIMQAFQIGGNVYGSFQLVIVNGSSIGLRANGAPTGPTDVLQLFTASSPTGFTDVVAAYTNGAGSLAAKHSAVEQVLVTAGLLPAGTVT